MNPKQKIYFFIFILIAVVLIALLVFLWNSPESKNLESSQSQEQPQDQEQSQELPIIDQENYSNNSLNNNPIQNQDQKTEVVWKFDYDTKEWKVSGIPPSCSDPIIVDSPANVNLATSVLYPGQIRGGDYKPHGGFRFDNQKNNDIDIYASIDAHLFKAARHLESGEVQYSLYFINDCGIMYKLDHLRQLTSKFEEILKTIHMGGEGDSRTTEISPSVFVEKGEHIATKVGFISSKNVGFDFGLYDLRKTNGVNYDSTFRNRYMSIDEYGAHALCWLENLKEPDKSIVKSLPGADGKEGKNSDYCK